MIQGHQINKANQFPIVDILEYFGFQPCENRGKEYRYFSPFREEKTPSFSVNIKLNKAKDFGDDENSGDAIRIYRKLSGKSFVESVHDLMNNKINVGTSSEIIYKEIKQEKKKAEIVLVKENIENKNLIHYLQSRGITLETANRFCNEVHYKQPSGKIFYSIGFRNISGGYELRSANFKSCIGSKDVSLIKGSGNHSQIIFEGFFNMLSYFEILKLRKAEFNELVSVVVLNSTSNYKSIPISDVIYCLLDNDKSGISTFKKIKERFKDSKVVDYSIKYGYQTDLNDFLLTGK